MRVHVLAFLALFSLVCAAGSRGDAPKSATLIRVIDGDTLKVKMDGSEETIRLFGIDCPEKGQSYGAYATEAAREALNDEALNIVPLYRDKYKRIVAIVLLNNGSSLQEILISQGAAWVYPAYCNIPECKKWEKAEEDSLENRIGLWWDQNSMPPWQWRKQNDIHNKKTK